MAARILYLDCSAGASGDMILGALVDLGLPFTKWTEELQKLRVRGFRVRRSRATRSGIGGTRILVETPDDPGHRHLSDFARIIETSRLSARLKERSLALITRIYAAEARVHRKRPEKIHLHELGSLDTLVDVVGTLIGLELLDVAAVEASPVNLGGGQVRTEHGLLPVPAPATLLLLKGAPVFSDGSRFERTTPTGALLVSGLARRFGPFPAMRIEKVGYGLGSMDPDEGAPNALRAVLGEPARNDSSRALVLEATIDDMSPEIAGYLMERLFESGALDVFITPVQMKKNRPGLNLTVLCAPEQRAPLTAILFAESTTLGARWHEVERQMLERRSVRVDTPFGKIAVKIGLANGRVVNAAPEFDACRRAARAHGTSLKEVQQAALASFRKNNKNDRERRK